jgi:large repetitive protein
VSVSLLQGMTNGTDDIGLTFNFAGGSLSGSYDTIEFSAGSGDFKVGAVSIVQITEGSDQSFEVTATATDGDGDVVTDTFDVTLDGNDGLIGSSGDDAISGGTGSDTISGGAGNDMLTGGAGGDTFQWSLGDEGTESAPAVDIIADFGNGTDKLDLRDLLQGEHNGSGIDASNLSSYLVGFDYVNATNSTIVNVSTHGDGVVDQQIVLAAVDITNQGALSDATIIANLLSQQKLVVDS